MAADKIQLGITLNNMLDKFEDHRLRTGRYPSNLFLHPKLATALQEAFPVVGKDLDHSIANISGIRVIHSSCLREDQWYFT